MKEQKEFLEQLNKLTNYAKEHGNQVSVEEVDRYFSKEDFSKEQIELVYDYLFEKKIVVKGMIEISFTDEEVAYLKEYEKDLEAFQKETEGEKEELFRQVMRKEPAAKERLIQIYLKKVVEIAKEMYLGDVSIEDMIQEGNIGLLMGVEKVSSVETAEQEIIGEIRRMITMLIQEETEVLDHDRHMLKKIEELDEAITKLTEELGRKVTIEELSVHMGVEEEEIEDLLRIAGEESGDEEEER